tara:strand:- start:792 stop:1415 length:624 start_codon:yes stop_codon:yes gene_type:complete
MNQKNSLGLDACFGENDNPLNLFKEWFEEAKKHEINDPNALSLATSDKKGTPSVRIVLLKDLDDDFFVFYTNLNSEKSKLLKENSAASMCFHWKSISRQIRITGKVLLVQDETADKYFSSRPYDSKISAWASNQSSVLKNRDELINSIENYKKKYSDSKEVPRPNYWSGWKLKPDSIEFWLEGKNRIHDRLKYIKKENEWKKILLSP